MTSEGQSLLHYVEVHALATKYIDANNSLSALAPHVTPFRPMRAFHDAYIA